MPGVIPETEQYGEFVEAARPVLIVTERCRIHVPMMAQPPRPTSHALAQPSTQTFGPGYGASSEQEFSHVDVVLARGRIQPRCPHSESERSAWHQHEQSPLDTSRADCQPAAA